MNFPLEQYHEANLLGSSTFAAAKAGYLTESDLENHMRRRLIGYEPISGCIVDGKSMSIWDALRQGWL